MTEAREVEIGGAKVNIPLPSEPFSVKVGDKVRVLVKEYTNTYRIDAGIVLGFCQFRKLPSIVVAHLKAGYNPELMFSTLNSQTEDKEICPSFEGEVILEKEDVLEALEKAVQKKQIELDEIKAKRDYIVNKFDAWFGNSEDIYRNAAALAAGLGAPTEGLSI